MLSRKPVDEWGLIVQKQSDLNKLREYEERVNKNIEKNDYRKDLLFQQQLRDSQKKSELVLKQQESQEINQKVLYFKNQEDLKKLQENQLKKQISEDYLMHQNYIKQKELQEKKQKCLQEQEHLYRVRSEVEADEKRRKEARDKWSMEQLQILNFKREQEMMKKEAELNDKQYELELIRQRRAKDDQRDQNYKEYYQKVNLHQTHNMDKLNQYMAKDTKTQERADWIDKNIAEQKNLLEQKEEYEKYIRQANIRSNNTTLKQQMEEKERQRLMDLEDQRKQDGEHLRRIQDSMKFEQTKEIQKRLQRIQYSEDLFMQKTQWNDEQLMTYKLSDNEKKFNKGIIDDKMMLQRGGAQILKNRDFNTYEDNLQKFYASDFASKTPQIPPKQQSQYENSRKNGFQSVSYNRPTKPY
jgi:hypothetical protein